MARATPQITDGILAYREALHEHTIAVGSSLWWQWLAAEGTTTFRFEHPLGNFTARRERKREGSYWYAYRTRDGALQKAYLGKSADLTLDRLQSVAVALAARATPAGDPVPSIAESTSPAAAGFPTGTVTFLFTDIEGSTTLWEQQPQTMSAALARHDAILREIIAAHSGVVFKTVGDAFHAVFATAPAAIDAALALQRALHAEGAPSSCQLRVRIALHTGVAELRDGDYFGPPLNRVARLLAAAHGGQILLSLATEQLVRDQLPPHVSVRDLGTNPLKDLRHPERIFQLVTADLPVDFPPLRIPAASPRPAASLPLLSTKLTVPPPRPKLVSRPRLLERLRAGVRGPLTLLAAPAGFGKTTLVADWLASRSFESNVLSSELSKPEQTQNSELKTHNFQVAWVSLDVGDNDPVRFWSYAIAALQSVHAGLGADALALLQSPQPPPLTTVLTLLINALAALPAPVVLVLDDYHAITASTIHESLAFLLEHLPPQLRLVIISRSDPPLPLMRLRAHGELTDLRAADLGFTTDEVETFFNQVLGLRLAADEVAALAARTEGWIAGLVLAAHALPGHANAAAFIRELAGSYHFILDYLVEDVLQQQPDRIQRFLLDTAILDRLNASLCDAVTEQSDSQGMLELLERANLFLVPLDRQRRWYRYHQLFAEMLRSRAQQLQPERLLLVHRRAASWYVQQGLIPEAVDHALAAGDMEQAASLVEQIAQATFLRGEVRTLLGWLRALPAAIVHARPLLSLVHAWALDFTGHVDAAEAQLEDVGQHMQQQATAADGPLLGGAAAALQAFVAGQRGDVPGMMALAQQALAFDTADSGEPRSLSLLALGNAHFFNGDLAAAHQTLTQLIATHEVTGDLFATMLAIYILADVEMHEGQLRQAAELLQQGAQLGTGPDGQPMPIAGLARMALGEILRERNELEAAMHSLRTGIALARQWGIHILLVDGTIALARLHQACGDGDGALQVLRDFEAQTHDAWDTPWHRAQLAACRARLWLAQGQRALASQWAQDYAARLEADAPKLRPLVKYAFAHTTLARVRLAEGRPEEAAQLLTRLLALAEAGGWMGDVIEILALQALALQAQGASTQALTTLRRALALAEPEGYVRIFVDEGAPMAALLARMKDEGGRMRGYIHTLLAGFGEREDVHPSSFIPQPLVEPLSERELEVLRLLAAGLESPEIARELIISVSTARSHIKNIYGKLDVHGRVQAIERARALGLVRP
jgi:LuxR family maltose regulon positive regulatory protein